MKNKASLLPFVILGLITVLGCGRFLQQANNSVTNSRSESSNTSTSPGTFALEGKEWKSFELEQMDIKVDLPGEPGDKTPPTSMLPRGWDQVFKSMKIHSYDEADFGSSYSQLVPTGKRKFTIEELAETSMMALKKQARDLEYKLDVKSPSNAKYIGTFTRNGRDFELRGCCIFQKTDPMRVWAVITVYAKDNADGQAASQRIIDSVVFRDSSESCK